MLVRSLDQHEHIRCLGELFIAEYPNNTTGSFEAYVRSSAARRLQRTLLPGPLAKRYLDWIASGSRDLFFSEDKWRNCQALGFKLMHGQATRVPAALRWVRGRGMPVIQLVRTNVLRVLISREVNRVLETPHTTRAIAVPAVALDLAKLLPALQRIEAINRDWPRLVEANPYLRVTYEDLVSHRSRELGRVLEFLGLRSDQALESPLVKLNTHDLPQAIANFEEVAARLRGSAFEHCLAD